MLLKIRSFFDRMKQQYEADELFHNNEIQANRMIMTVLKANSVILILILIAVKTGVFPYSDTIFFTVVRALAEIVFLWYVSKKVRQDTWWLKYLLLLGVLAVYARIDSILTHKVAILMVLPVLCASRYFSKKLTIIMSATTAVVFFFSALYGSFYGWINMNDVTVPEGSTVTNTTIWLGSGIEETLDRAQYAHNTIIFTYFPKLLMFTLAAIICVNISKRGRKMVEEQRELSTSRARIETELSMATQIQEGMLPHIYPPFPDRKEFDIYATMNPAREVGGDFYDYFLIDEDHLAIVMADVSGKGVPAALFMMASKIIIANNAMNGLSPAKVLEATNSAICSHNPQEMFVTVWLGFLEISTGILTAANAGHEYPAVMKNGRFELYKDRHGFVIGGLDGVKYQEYTLQLEPGDKVFLYTDGVTEATDQNEELFGTERMLSALNRHPDSFPRMILMDVQNSVEFFAGKAEQFDDLTMLCLDYKGS